MSHLRKLSNTLPLMISLLLGVATAPAHATTSLLDIYDRAAQNDPEIRAADANRLATREARPQAWAQLLPQHFCQRQLVSHGLWCKFLRNARTLEHLPVMPLLSLAPYPPQQAALQQPVQQ